jgi:hypothetical protein
MSKLFSLSFLVLLICSFFVTSCSKESPRNAPKPTLDSPPSPSVPSTPNSGNNSQLPSGPGEGGGGDPDTQQFIVYAQKLAVYFKENPSQLELPFKAVEFEKAVQRLDQSIQDKKLQDLVEFTSDVLADKNQVSKVALFDQKSFSIRVYRPYWITANIPAKLTLIAMEITGLVGIELRYENAHALVHDKSALILAMKLPNNSEKTPINWRMANQDADLFARLNSEDVIIDGGVIGTGAESNLRVERFFKAPLQDKEWMLLAQKAFDRKMPAYLVLRDESGNRASITAFRDSLAEQARDAGIVSYSLLFFSKSKPVGSCSHTAIDLAVLDRLKSCFFDLRFYDLWETTASEIYQEGEVQTHQLAWQNTFQKTYQQLLNHYSNSTEALADTLQSELIQDYSALFPPSFKQRILRETALANGLQPTLLRGETAFWKMSSSNKNAKSVRFFSALKKMAEARVGFYPSHMARCVGAGGKIATAEDSKIVPLSELQEIIKSDSCLERDGLHVESSFFRALAQAGYVYDPVSEKWSAGPAREIPSQLMAAQFKISNELETRFVTENQTPQKFLQVLRETLHVENTADRLGIYLEVLPHWPLLGLDKAAAENLYRLALADIKTLASAEKLEAPAGSLNWRIGKLYPLNEFVSENLVLAVTNDLFTASLSKEFIEGVLTAPWLTEQLAREFIHLHFSHPKKKSANLPHFSWIMTELIKRPFFNKELRAYLVEEIFRPYHNTFSSPANGVLHSYVELNNILVQLGRSAPLFEKAAAFEKQALLQKLDKDAQAKLLLSLLTTPAETATLANLVVRFLITAPISMSAKNALVHKLLEHGKLLAVSSAFLQALATLPFFVELENQTQESIFEFVIPAAKTDADGVRNEILVRAFERRDWLVPDVPGIQRALELIAEQTTDFANDFIGAQHAWEFTEADRIIQDLETCKTKKSITILYDPQICQLITSPKSILEKIIANRNLPEGLRQKAQKSILD